MSRFLMLVGSWMGFSAYTLSSKPNGSWIHHESSKTMTQIQTTVVKTLEETTTETIPIAPNVEACRVTVVRTGPKGGHRSPTEVKEFVRHIHKVKDENYGGFVVVAPELRERLRMNGWFQGSDWELIHQEKPFTHVTAGNPYEVVRLKSYDHTLYDAKDKPLPVGMRFRYLSGGVDNRNFDLTKLLDHLQKRKDVTLLKHYGEGSYIHSIPHYNCESGRSKCLAFIWHSDVRTYRRYTKKLSTLRASFDRYAVAHTMMGNDKFRLPEKTTTRCCECECHDCEC